MATFLWDNNTFDWGFVGHIDRIIGNGRCNSPYVLYRTEAKTIYTELFEGFYFAGWKIESLSSKEYFKRQLKGR